MASWEVKWPISSIVAYVGKLLTIFCKDKHCSEFLLALLFAKWPFVHFQEHLQVLTMVVFVFIF